MNPYTSNISDKGQALIDELVTATDWPAVRDDPFYDAIEALADRSSVARDRIAATYGVDTYDDYNGLSGESQTGLQRDDGLIFASDWYEEFWFVSLMVDDDHIAATTVDVPQDIATDDEARNRVLRDILAYYVAFAEGADTDDFPNTEV